MLILWVRDNKERIQESSSTVLIFMSIELVIRWQQMRKSTCE